jgi:ACT domain-containing protein
MKPIGECVKKIVIDMALNMPTKERKKQALLTLMKHDQITAKEFVSLNKQVREEV